MFDQWNDDSRIQPDGAYPAGFALDGFGELPIEANPGIFLGSTPTKTEPLYWEKQESQDWYLPPTPVRSNAQSLSCSELEFCNSSSTVVQSRAIPLSAAIQWTDGRFYTRPHSESGNSTPGWLKRAIADLSTKKPSADLLFTMSPGKVQRNKVFDSLLLDSIPMTSN